MESPLIDKPSSVAATCDHLVKSIKSYLKEAIRWNQHQIKYPEHLLPLIIADEAVQLIFIHILTIRETSLFIAFPPRTQINIVISLQSHIDSIERELAYLKRSSGSRQGITYELISKSKKAIQNLKRDVERIFAMLPT